MNNCKWEGPERTVHGKTERKKTFEDDVITNKQRGKRFK